MRYVAPAAENWVVARLEFQRLSPLGRRAIGEDGGGVSRCFVGEVG